MCSAARIDPHRAGPCDPMGQAEPSGTVRGHLVHCICLSGAGPAMRCSGPISPLCANSWSHPTGSLFGFFFFLFSLSLCVFVFVFILTWRNQAGGEASGSSRHSVLREPGGERGKLVTCHVGAVAFIGTPKAGRKTRKPLRGLSSRAGLGSRAGRGRCPSGKGLQDGGGAPCAPR